MVSGLVFPSDTSPWKVTESTAQLSASSFTTDGSTRGGVSHTVVVAGLLAVGLVVSPNPMVKTSKCWKSTPSKYALPKPSTNVASITVIGPSVKSPLPSVSINNLIAQVPLLVSMSEPLRSTRTLTPCIGLTPGVLTA